MTQFQRIRFQKSEFCQLKLSEIRGESVLNFFHVARKTSCNDRLIGSFQFNHADLDVEAVFSRLILFVPGKVVPGVLPDNVSILDVRFSIILRISLWFVSAFFLLLLTDFSTFSKISEKTLSEMVVTFFVLRLAASDWSSELVKDFLLAFLLDDLSGILYHTFFSLWSF